MSSLVNLIVSIPVPFNMIVLIVLILALVQVLRTVAFQAGKYAIRRRELDFKREMIDRGLEVDEIERLLTTGKSGRDGWNTTSWEGKS